MVAGAGASHDFMRKTGAGKRKDALRASARSLYLDGFNAAFHEIWSLSMSSFITDPLSFPAIQLGDPAARVHQPTQDQQRPFRGVDGSTGPSGAGSASRCESLPTTSTSSAISA
jgi:hypothetical protein